MNVPYYSFRKPPFVSFSQPPEPTGMDGASQSQPRPKPVNPANPQPVHPRVASGEYYKRNAFCTGDQNFNIPILPTAGVESINGLPRPDGARYYRQFGDLDNYDMYK